MAKSGKGKKKKKVAKKANVKPKEKKAVKKPKKEEEGVRGIVRLAGRDMSGYYKLNRALLYVKGIGHSLRNVVASLIEKELGIPHDIQIGRLTYEQVESIDNLLYNLDESKLPSFLLNRRKDIVSGKSVHRIMNELDFAIRQDIERKKKSRTWQGYRHMRGKKVRGQRTKNTGRRGITVGVVGKGKKK